ncbi:probable 20S rRNA accumulation protein 4 [Oryza brachyantha]|uniref:Programmed cell death protein 2 C-terminal domain-containing protein n=1 Tax=Oryza brachyantha TaxID=4533 RepID=J3M1V2_ORYBR|nr:probable 20S rRNA accumulation protein 4 [Oryza brachyantha]
MGEEVHLGLPGPWAEDYREKADHYTTKIGGVPDWPTEDLGIKPHLLECSLCGNKLCLVAQVYAPVAKLNIENRTIYVLVCPKPKCGSNPQSWKVLRVQKCHSTEQTDGKVDETDQIKENFCSSEPSSSSSLNKSNEASDDDFDLDALANALEQAATLASNSKKQNKSKCSNAPIKCPTGKEKVDDPGVPVLPCFYIYYDKEKSRGKCILGSNSSESVLVKGLADVANDDEEKWEGENYEYERAIGADRTFLKFKKRLDAYPQQCFRYSCGGKPLLAAINLQDPGTCQLCGSPRQYELQFMSPLSYFLHEAGDGSLDYAPDGWTWLTLIIYTCAKSCCPSSCVGKSRSCCWGVAEEEIMIQED